MQVVDWISTGGWSDEPECVHDALRCAAITTNDFCDDTQRQQLVKLIPRLMGTGIGSGYELDGDLWYKLDNLSPDDEDICNCDVCARERGHEVDQGQVRLDALIAMLDAYDEYTGRTQTPKIDFAPVCEVMGRPIPA